MKGFTQSTKPHISVDFFFLVNQSQDATEFLVKDYPYRVYDTDVEGTSELRGKYSFLMLAYLRNKVLEYAQEMDYDFYFSLDSDILVPEDTLVKLLGHYDTLKSVYHNDKIAVSAMVRNYDHPKNGLKDEYPAHNMLVRAGTSSFTHVLKWESDQPYQSVDVTGAAVLIPKASYHVKYGMHPQGEDCAWGLNMDADGGMMFAVNDIQTIHMMSEENKAVSGLPC